MASTESSRTGWDWSKLYNKVIAASLVVAGAAGLFISLSAFLAKAPTLSFLNVPADAFPIAILFVVSSFCIGLGLERLSIAVDLKREVVRTHDEVLSAVGVLEHRVQRQGDSLSATLADIRRTMTELKPLRDYEQVYREAMELVLSSQGTETIRATSFGTHGAHENYLETLATAIQQKKSNRMSYRVVMGFQLDDNGQPPAEYQAAVLKRRTVFDNHGIAERLHIRCIDSAWSLDILLIGSQHLIVGFPTLARDPRLTLGLRLSDRSFVEQVVEWFDEQIWSKAAVVQLQGSDQR